MNVTLDRPANVYLDLAVEVSQTEYSKLQGNLVLMLVLGLDVGFGTNASLYC